MPFRIAFDDPIIRIDFSGELTATELPAVLAELRQVEAGFDRLPDRLTNLTDVVRRESTYHYMLDVARQRRDRVFPNSFRSAIVAPTQESIGFARMFQILNTNPQITIQIFDTLVEAEEWLGIGARGVAPSP